MATGQPSDATRSPAESLIGREAELEVLSRFLSGVSPESCLVISGDPGIGKTTLWQAGVHRAKDEGFHVLSTRPSGLETDLLFAGLADLVDGIDLSVFRQIPEPQAQALQIALRRAGPEGTAVDRFAVFAGFLSAIVNLGTSTRPLIAVDDVQWLDASSAACLVFLARRLSGMEIRLLISRRGDEPSSLERALDPAAVQQLALTGLSLGALARILSDRCAFTPPRRVLHRIYETSQGNPLFAIELAHTVQERGLPPIGSDLPFPKVADDALARRVGALPERVRRVLLTVALNERLNRDELASVVGRLAVEDAVDGDLLVTDRDRMRPSHPTFASAARKLSSSAERRDLHLLLMTVVADPVLRARHRALSLDGVDAAAASDLAAVAALALERGAIYEAEELSAHALRLTPPGSPEEPMRVLELAQNQINAGDLTDAESLLRDRIAQLPSGRPRAMGYLLLAATRESSTCEEQLDLAIVEAAADPGLRGAAVARKSMELSLGLVGRLDEAEALALDGCAISEGTEYAGIGRLALSWTRILRGAPIDDVRAGAGQPARGPVVDSVDRPAAIREAFRGEVARAREIILRLVALADDLGQPMSRAVLAVQLCEFALRQGNVTEAAATLEELEQWGALGEVQVKHPRLKAVIAALAGRPQEVRRWAAPLAAESSTSVFAWDCLEAHRALGLAALFEGDFGTAVTHFGRVWQHCRRERVEDPGAFPVAGDLVEGLVATGDLAQAEAVTDLLGTASKAQRHPWGLATTSRAQGLIAFARDDFGPSLELLGSAASRYQALGLDFESARCLLWLGQLHRRTQRRSEARKALQGAVDLFSTLGCEGWASKARAESSGVSGRRAVGADQLTSREEQVVTLAVQGLSNKEIAKALFVSVYTVEDHLSHAYAKLGVRSRSQLASRLDGR